MSSRRGSYGYKPLYVPRRLHRVYDEISHACFPVHKQRQVYHPSSPVPDASYFTPHSQDLDEVLSEPVSIKKHFLMNSHPIRRQSLASRLILARQSGTSSNSEEQETVSRGSQDFITALEKFTKDKALPLPQYKTLTRKPGEFFSCVLIGEEHSFTSYPEESLTVLQAQQIAAENALHGLTKLYSSVGDETGVKVNVKSMLYNIVKVVKEYDTGLWLHDIPHQYGKRYGTLPTDWSTVVRNCSYLEFQDVSCGKTIVTINQSFQLPDSYDEMIIYHYGDSVIERISLQEKMCDVLVTNIISAREIYVRLLGKNYDDKFCALYEEMRAFYEMAKPCPVPQVREGCFYMIKLEGYWHRVMLLTAFETIGKLNFIDCGITEDHPLKSLFMLDPKFSRVPAQSVRCSMVGLEHIAGEDEVTKLLKAELYDKCVIAVAEEWRDKENYARVTFYDTSTNKDLNVNLDIAEKICVKAKLPNIENNHTYMWHISHISNDPHWFGIYLRYHDKYFNCVTDIFQSLMKYCRKDITPLKSLEVETFRMEYLAFSEERGAWYRSEIVTHNPASQILTVRFVDLGVTEQVYLSNICLTKNVSSQLDLMPRQALRVELVDTVLTRTIATKLQKLLPIGHKVFIQKGTTQTGVRSPLSIYSPMMLSVYMWKLCDDESVIRVNYSSINAEETDDLKEEFPLHVYACCPHSGSDNPLRTAIPKPSLNSVPTGAQGRLNRYC